MNDGTQPADDAGVMDDVFDRDRIGDDAPIDGGGPARDDHGRFAPRQEATTEPEQPAAPTEPEQPSSDQPDRRVPLSELQSERKKRQEYEQRFTQIQQEAAAREAYYQQQLRQYQQPQQPPEDPDLFEDPDGFFKQRLDPIQQRLENTRLDLSEDRARERFGDDTVNEALQAASRMGILGNFAQGRHPYGELVQWFEREKTLNEVGTDPAAYREKLLQEARQQVLEEMKTGKSPGQPQPRFPTSLADQTSAGGQGAVISEQGLMNEMFHPDRNRRA